MKYLLGLDLGTTGYKIALFDIKGKIKASTYKALPTDRPAPGRLEQDADDWWSFTVHSIKQILKETKIDSVDIAGIGVTGEGPSLVCVDNQGEVLRKAMIIGDVRARPQAEKLTKSLAFRAMAKVLRAPTDPYFFSQLPGLRLEWIRENEPEVFSKIHGCMMSWDFIKFKLTGRVTHFKGIAQYLLGVNKFLKIPDTWFGDAIENTTDIAGHITDGVAKVTGLKAGTPVILGTFDNPCNAVGSGLTEEGIAMAQAGGTEIINVALGKSVKEGYTQPHFIPGLWLTGSSPSRGVILGWFLDQFSRVEKEQAQKSGENPYSILDQQMAQIDPGANGLIFLPYLSGENAAFNDPHARGLFIGISMTHTRNHFLRAIYEGIAFSLRHILENIQELGVEIKEIRIGGGGAKSKVWNQIKADVTGIPVSVLEVLETGCLGITILTSVGVGVYPNVLEASKAMIRVAERIEPNPDATKRYTCIYKIYRETYKQTRDIFAKLAPLRGEGY